MNFTVKFPPDSVTIPTIDIDGDMRFSSIAIPYDSSTNISCMLSDILRTETDTVYENVNSLHEQGNDVVVDFDKVNGDYKSIAHLIPKVKKTYVNHRTVIVKFEDGTFEKATATDDDYFSTETGVCICLFKKVLDRLLSGHGSSVYNKLMDYTLSKGVENSEKKAKKTANETAKEER